MNRNDFFNMAHVQEKLDQVVDMPLHDLWLTADNRQSIDRSVVSSAGLTLHDHAGRILDADESAAGILSAVWGKWSGFRFCDPQLRVIQSDGRRLTEGHDPVKRALKKGEIIEEVLLGFQLQKGSSVRWLLVTAIPVTGKGDEKTRVVCLIRDQMGPDRAAQLPKCCPDLMKNFREIVDRTAGGTQPARIACQEILQLLPGCLSFPHVTHVKISLGDQTYHSINFKESTHSQFSRIWYSDSKIGAVAFHYHVEHLNRLPGEGLQADKGLRETLAEWLGMVFTIDQKNQEIADLKANALAAYDRTIEAWSAALEMSDKEASGHTRRVTELAVALAREMGFPDEELRHVRRGALLHDIGKLSIPDDIILKPGKLTADEYEIVKKHPEFTQKWLSQIELLKPALQIPYYHHEKWDGTGYPQGLVGEDIPLAARMFSVVDVWDVLISDRPYRRAMSKEEALDLILSEAGSQFDPEVVKHFANVLQRENRISASHQLKINAFKQARVWRHNQPISIKEWEIYAARDLFFLFLAHPKGLSKDQVGLHMWPDLSADEVDTRFKNTLYRLRRALGKETILLTGDCYHFNGMLDYRYDVACFTTHIQKAKEAEDPERKISHLIKAIEEYQGDYLQEIEELWVVNDRERYRMLFLEALVEAAELFFAQQNLTSALRYIHLALAEDPVLEAAHRLAMKIYSKLGDRAGVIRQYEICRISLLEKFDASPSKRTRELYELLRQT